jgi:hypothetical protein
VNALNSAHSLMMSTSNRNTSEAMRDRMNGHFFVSGILYETLKLIRSMSSIFAGDQSYATSMRMVLKDASGQALEQMHLKSARHVGVFHFAADPVRRGDCEDSHCRMRIYLLRTGRETRGIHHDFADLITAEMLVGKRIDDGAVVNDMFEKTLDLVQKITEHSESFIADQLNVWGFEIRPS